MSYQAVPAGGHLSTPRELKERLDADARGEPYLFYRDAEGRQRIVSLPRNSGRLTIGRSDSADIALPWDSEVSRVHAAIERLADRWALIDDGLSMNGSFVNHERVHGRRLLSDGDMLRFGETPVAFRDPSTPSIAATAPASDGSEPPPLTKGQRRVLVALCRPYAEGRPFPAPASNQQIAEELVVTVDAVKSQLRLLCQMFGLDDLPRQEKRLRLVECAFESGAIGQRDFERGA